MKYIKITLDVPYEKTGTNTDGCKTVLTCYLPDRDSTQEGQPLRKAVVICPGGGYEYCSEREAEPVALRFAGYGICAFVLNYSCERKRFPVNLFELCSAVAYVRNIAGEYHIDAEKVFVCGFSAGGHLAASLAVHWNKPYVTSVFKDNRHKPDGALLCYPVITSGEFTHRGSIENITGNEQAPVREVSLENHVSQDTPPVFIWHTSDDGTVPVQNTVLFTLALGNNRIPFESHIYKSGVHGLSLADVTTARYEGHMNESCAGWFSLALKWINSINN